MNYYDRQPQIDDSFRGNVTEVKNKVLRQTYALLAISLIPAALGALLGIHFHLFSFASPLISTLIFLAGTYGLMYLVNKNRNNASGVFFLLGFTFFMGLMLSGLLYAVLHMPHGSEVVTYAFVSTAVIFFAMASVGASIKRDLSGMSKFLFIGVIALILASIANIFLMIPALSLAISTISVVVFSLYMMYDINNIVKGGETNYISATTHLFLNLYNIFTSLLNLFGIGIGFDD